MLVQDSLLYLNFFMVEGSVQQCLYITYDLTLNTDKNLPIRQSHSFELHHPTNDTMRSSGDKAHMIQICRKSPFTRNGTGSGRNTRPRKRRRGDHPRFEKRNQTSFNIATVRDITTPEAQGWRI